MKNYFDNPENIFTHCNGNFKNEMICWNETEIIFLEP